MSLSRTGTLIFEQLVSLAFPDEKDPKRAYIKAQPKGEARKLREEIFDQLVELAYPGPGSKERYKRDLNAEGRKANAERRKVERSLYYQNNKEKMDAAQKAWVAANKERYMAGLAAARERNKDAYNKKAAEWRARNPDKVAAGRERNREMIRLSTRANAKRISETLADPYIKALLKRRDVPLSSEAIQLKRAIITFKRTTKEIKNETI